MLDTFAQQAMNYIALLIMVIVVIALITIAVLYVIDSTQNTQAIRRNYPVIGRFRYFFEHLGEFFRQYFFAMDREEMPFNRAMRTWVYKAAKNIDLTIAFGSTRNLRVTGEPLFLNSAFPTLDEDATESGSLTIGPDCKTPYHAPSFFNISGMSYGALSRVAIQALSHGAKKAGCWVNTGEGGLSPYHLEGGCDIVFQIGTAKYGVRDSNGNLSHTKLKELAAIEQVKMFELKLSQGAKPGKGGILPAEKVNTEIASIRGIPVGEASISPNRHKDVANNEQLLELIAAIRETTGKPVGFKAVMGDPAWLEELCRLITVKGNAYAPDFISVDCAEGGTGAAPQPLMDYVGLPIRESLPLLVDTLKEFGLRDRIKVIASGKLVNPGAVAVAMATGADFAVSARGFMFALGCIQALQCNKNTCPTGITTHDKKLQKGLDPTVKSERVANYHYHLVKSVETIAHSCGVRSARMLEREHVRLVTENGFSRPLSLIHPEKVVFVEPPKKHTNKSKETL